MNSKKYTIFPIEHFDVWKMYKTAVSLFWVPEEVDLSKDLNDWNNLTIDERNYILRILAFFATSDGIVNLNLVNKFLNEAKNNEIEYFYSFQIMMENIHTEMYGILLNTYVFDENEKNELFRANETIPTIKKKSDWAIKWISDKKYEERLLAFACVEGIFFSSSFAGIFWLKKRNLLPGLTFSNELISRDEALHTDFAILLYNNYIDERLDEKTANQIVSEAVEIEINFIKEAIPVNLIGINVDLMSDYIKYIADRLLIDLKYNKIYNTNNPFDFMENISLDGKTNFFDKKVSEYRLANIQKDKIFNTFEDF